MRRRLALPGMLAALLAASPASAQTWAAFHEWDFCSGNALSACMNFELTRQFTSAGAATSNYQLMVRYVSSLAEPGQTGAMTSAGLYRLKQGSINLDVANLHIVSTTPSGVSWSVGSNQLGGEGPIVIEVAGNSDNGINNGLRLGGSILLGFRSANLGGYDIENLYARAHIQGYGENGCSLKPDSRGPDYVVDSIEEIDSRCGELPPPPPPPPEVVPEPITMVLLGSGLLGVGGAARRRRRNALQPKDDEA